MWSDFDRSLLLERPQHHRQVTTLETIGHLFELGNILEVRGYPPKEFETVLRTTHFAHAKHDGHLDVFALTEELAGPIRFGVEIVDVDVGPVLDLFEFDLVLLLLGLTRLLLLLEAEAPIVHDLADDGSGVGGNLYEIEPHITSHSQGLVDGDDTDLFAIGADEADRREPDSFIDSHLGCFRIVSERELADDLPPLFLGCLRTRPNLRPG